MTGDKGKYHSVDIGDIHLDGNLFLAPVAGWSSRAFRSICVEEGASLTTTEMISSEAVIRGNKKTALLARRAQNEKTLALQLFGSDPLVMGQAAKIVTSDDWGEDGKRVTDIIDINCGCPMPKITKCGAGAALMKDSKRLYDIIKAVAEARGDARVTIKIRKGWSNDDGIYSSPQWEKCARAAIDAGVMAITMHPRTCAQGYEGKADWEALAQLVKFVGGEVCVFGSGDLFHARDAERMIDNTGVNAVMFARGAMGNPFIFSETKALLTGKVDTYQLPCDEERIKMALREAVVTANDYGEEAACKMMRKRLVAYTKGLHIASSEKGELRRALVTCSTIEEYKKVLT